MIETARALPDSKPDNQRVMARDRGLQSKGSATSAMNPPVRLLAKLGSIVAHVDEGSGEGGHAFDWAAVRSLIADREVQEWLEGMRKAALLPVPRPSTKRAPHE